MIYTKKGDKGRTELFDGKRVSKADPRVEAAGTVDELNSVIGLAVAFSPSKKRKNILLKVQHGLFAVQAVIMKGKKRLSVKITDKHVKKIERAIDQFKTPKECCFVIPGGTKETAALHLARTECRRAERRIVILKKHPMLVKYMNRLSSLLFVMAIDANKGKVEIAKYQNS